MRVEMTQRALKFFAPVAKYVRTNKKVLQEGFIFAANFPKCKM